MSEDYDGYESKACKVPPTGQGTQEDFEKLFKEKITYDSTGREIDCSRWRKADLYDRVGVAIRPWANHGPTTDRLPADREIVFLVTVPSAAAPSATGN
jgi:hypothetical protein